MLRHEKAIDTDSPRQARSRQKNKKIIVTLTAKDSDILDDIDTETMDLSKKEQETSQLCRIMYQKARKDEGT